MSNAENTQLQNGAEATAQLQNHDADTARLQNGAEVTDQLQSHADDFDFSAAEYSSDGACKGMWVPEDPRGYICW